MGEKESDSEEVGVFYSEDPDNIETEVSWGSVGVEPVVESHYSEGMLLKNPKSNVTNEEVKLWRYLYKIPSTVEIRVPKTHERVD